MDLYMFHDFIISWSTIYPIILYFHGPIYSPFSTQIMDNYVDHYLYFRGLIYKPTKWTKHGSLYLSIFY